MSDEDFLESFESGSLAEFHHRDHIRMTWLYLRRDGLIAGPPRVATEIQRFAAARGAAAHYSETMTRLWIRLVAASIAADGPANSFEKFVEAHPELLNKDHALLFYRRETLASPTAKARWVEPDLEPLP